MATARVTSGSGYAPGYGKVSNPVPKKSSAWGGLWQSNVKPPAQTPVFTPQATAAQAAQTAAASKPVFDPTNLPVDPTYDAQQLGLLRNHDTTLARLEAGRGNALLNSGYTASYDSQGNATGLAFDPSNPYSQAALAKQSYDANKLGTTNGLAARGQLYSGAMQNAQGYNDKRYGETVDKQQKALLQFLANNQIDKSTANNDYNTGLGIASGDRLGRAVANWLAQNGGG